MKTVTARGATVLVRVQKKFIGDALHRLEYSADVHLLERRPCKWESAETWTLRSDRWPANWEGHMLQIGVIAGTTQLQFQL